MNQFNEKQSLSLRTVFNNVLKSFCLSNLATNLAFNDNIEKQYSDEREKLSSSSIIGSPSSEHNNDTQSSFEALSETGTISEEMVLLKSKKYTLVRTTVIFAALDIICSCFIFATSLGIWLSWKIGEYRWLLFYLNSSLPQRGIENDKDLSSIEIRYNNLVKFMCIGAVFVTAIRIIAANILMVGLIYKKIVLLFIYIIWNSLSFLFTMIPFIVLLIIPVFTNDRNQAFNNIDEQAYERLNENMFILVPVLALMQVISVVPPFALIRKWRRENE